MMEYKNYAAGPIDFDPEEKTFSGTVAGLQDVIHFEGGTAAELSRAFRRASTIILSFVPRTGNNLTALLMGRFWYALNRSCTAKRLYARRGKAWA